MPKATESRPEPGYVGLRISQPSFLASFSLNGNNICFAEVALVVKNSLANEGDKRDMGSIHGTGSKMSHCAPIVCANYVGYAEHLLPSGSPDFWYMLAILRASLVAQW